MANTGNAPLTMTITMARPNLGAFSPASAGGCYPSGGLAAGASCVINIEFSPSAVGAFSAFIALTDNSGGVAGSVQTITLSGVGGPASPVAVVNPPFLTFFAQSVGTPSGVQVVAVNNTGSSRLFISSIGIAGTNASEFQIVPSQTTCLTAGQTLAASGFASSRCIFLRYRSARNRPHLQFPITHLPALNWLC